jgi:hypothetical protein
MEVDGAGPDGMGFALWSAISRWLGLASRL